MLKAKEYVYETSNYKIINPNKELNKIIRDEIMKYQNEEGQIDFDNEEFNLYLFKLLVEFINEEFNFEQYSLSEFNDILNNPSHEIETIAFYIGGIISDIIINDLRQRQLEIKMANIELLQKTTIETLNSFKSDITQVEKNRKRLNDEKRVNKLIQEKELDEDIQVKKLNVIQKFLYKYNLIK